MPAHRLGQEAVDIRQFDVLGQDSEGIIGFVRHVGLSSEQRDQFGSLDTIRFTHMGPPMELGSAPERVHSCAGVPLTADEIQQIQVFIDERSLEYKAVQARSQYVIRPHVQAEREADGTVLFYRYSCAGFVVEAYRSAGLVFLLTDEVHLPDVSLDVLTQAYPDLASLLRKTSFREKWNLPGDGPWQVMLAGYVLNALNREESAIRCAGPHRATAGEEYFPARQTVQRSTA